MVILTLRLPIKNIRTQMTDDQWLLGTTFLNNDTEERESQVNVLVMSVRHSSVLFKVMVSF